MVISLGINTISPMHSKEKVQEESFGMREGTRNLELASNQVREEIHGSKFVICSCPLEESTMSCETLKKKGEGSYT